MFGEEKQSEELKAFEAELASLRPRADGLDPRWRFLLAQEATLSQTLPNGEGLAGGQFLCGRCGGTLSGGKRKSRWAWPAAFSAMTTVAAVLLVALVVRVEPRTAAPGGRESVPPPSIASAERPGNQNSPLAISILPGRRPFPASDETAYLSLRDQVLRFGVESWQSPPSAVAATKNKPEPVLTPRDHFDRLQKQEGSFGS